MLIETKDENGITHLSSERQVDALVIRQPEFVAENIALKIAGDISDRGGLGDEWELIDDKTRAGILATWKKIILKQLAG